MAGMDFCYEPSSAVLAHTVSRVLRAEDMRKGCPAAAKANSRLLQKTFELAGSSLLIVTGHMVRKVSVRFFKQQPVSRGGRKGGLKAAPQTPLSQASGTTYLDLFLDGRRKDRTQTYTYYTAFRDAAVFWSGIVARGTHSVWLSSPTANAWGCSSDFGDLDIVSLPAAGVGQAPTPSSEQPAPPSTTRTRERG